MRKDITKIVGTLVLLGSFVASYTVASHTIAQTSPTNFGSIVRYDENVIESPWGAGGNALQIQNSSCPDGSVLVGFNLINVGENYSGVGSLYCKTVALNFGPITAQNKSVIETPWGGPGTGQQIQNSSCPDGSVLVGFNLLNMGENYSTVGVLYCRQVLSAKDAAPVSGSGSVTSTVTDAQEVLLIGEDYDNATELSNPTGYGDRTRIRSRGTQEP